MTMTIETSQRDDYGLRPGAEEFPLMIVMSIIYPCNFGCPMCPYTDGNSEIRQFYAERRWRAVSGKTLGEHRSRMWRIRRVDALHRRW